MQVKMKKFSWSYEKKFSANQNSQVCMKTTDIKSLINNKIKCDPHIKIYVWNPSEDFLKWRK